LPDCLKNASCRESGNRIKGELSLTFRTNAEKFQFVGDAFVTVPGGNLLLYFPRKTFFNLNDF
jgi:hypothetical protein